MPFEDTVITKFIAESGGPKGLTPALQTFSRQFGAVKTSAKQSGTQVGQQLDNMTTKARKTADGAKELRQQTSLMSSGFRQSAASLMTGNKALDTFAIRLDRSSMMMWKFTMASIPIRGAMFAFAGAAIAGGMALKKFAEEATLIESTKRAFTAMTGSIYEAGQSVEYLRDQAPKIRYSLTQVLEAGRVIQVAGYDIRSLIYPMADLASGINQSGVDIADASRAFVDAMHGEFRRLRNTFDITKEEVRVFAGDAINAMGQVVDKNRMQIALIQAITKKYGGANEAMMATMIGSVSNLGDQAKRLFATIGENITPVFIDWMNTTAGLVGQLNALMKNIGGTVTNTLLWGTAISGVTAGILALIYVGLQFMGILASLGVYLKTYSKDYERIMAAELKMAEIHQAQAVLSVARNDAERVSIQAKIDALTSELGIKTNLLNTDAARAGAAAGTAAIAGPGGVMPRAAPAAGFATRITQMEQEATRVAQVRQAVTQKVAQTERTIANLQHQGWATTLKRNRLQEDLTRFRSLEGRLIAEQDTIGLGLQRQRVALVQAETLERRRQAALARVRYISETGPKARFGAGVAGGAAGSTKAILAITGITEFSEAIESVIGKLKGITLANLAGFAGGLIGALGPLALFAAVIAGVVYVLKYSAQVQKNYAATIKDGTDTVKEWTEMFGAPAGMAEPIEKLSNAIDKLAPMEGATLKRGHLFPASELFKKELPVEEVKFAMAALIEEAIEAGMPVYGAQPQGGWVKGQIQEQVYGMDIETLKKINLAGNDAAIAIQSLGVNLEQMMGTARGLGIHAEINADAWIDAQIASGKLSEEQKTIYETMKASGRTSFEVAKILKRQIEEQAEGIESAKDIEQRVDKRLKSEDDVDTVLREETVELKRQQALLAAQETDMANLKNIAPKMYQEQVKKNNKLRDELDIAERILKLKKEELNIAKLTAEQTVYEAGGGKFAGFVFGPQIWQAELDALAKAEKGSKEYEERLVGAWKAATDTEESTLGIALAMSDVGENASAAEKAQQAMARAAAYRAAAAEKQRKLEALINEVTDGQTKKRARLYLNAEIAASKRSAEAEDLKALTIPMEDQLNIQKAQRDLMEAQGASNADILRSELQTIEAEKQLALLRGDSTVELDAQLKTLNAQQAAYDRLTGKGSAQLGLLEKMAEQGWISENSVEAYKRQMFMVYTTLAQQQKSGSEKQIGYLSSAMDMLADNTEDAWSGIIGKIIGAPEELIKDLVSEGGLTRRWGNMISPRGPHGGSGIEADIIGQNRKEVTYRIKFEDFSLAQVDDRVRRVMPAAINALVAELKRAFN